MRKTPLEVYQMLIDNDNGILNKNGKIEFTLNNVTVEISSKDSIGNLIQSWLKGWLDRMNIDYIEPANTQRFPDYHLNPGNLTENLLEVKCFDIERGPGFDIANFDTYCSSLLTDAYRLNSDYLIIGYKMEGVNIFIGDIWLKKVWQIAGGSKPWPIKVQDKRNIIYNIRPVTWYSKRSKFKPFANVQDFLAALNQTRYQYHATRANNNRWLNDVIANYHAHTGQLLHVPRHE